MPLPVTVWTLWHGTEVTGPGSVTLLAGELSVEIPAHGAAWRIAFSALDGVKISEDHLTLYATTGDVIELTGPGVAEVAAELRAELCIVPELTLSLRAIGSARGFPGPDHDRFFAPVLAARRTAQRAADPAQRVAALRAAALAAEMERVLHEFAVARYPSDPAERRALETVFEDLFVPVRDRLVQLEAAAQAVGAARDDAAFVRWREWAGECRAVFAAADRCWLAVGPILRGTPTARDTAWRWPWGRKRATSGNEAGERRA